MTLTIELTEDEAAKLNRLAIEQGATEEGVFHSWLATVPPIRHLTAQELLRLPREERRRYLQAAAEDARPLYEADLALPPQERELTAMSAISGMDFIDTSDAEYAP